MSGVTIKGNMRDHGLYLDCSEVTFLVVICHSSSVSQYHGGNLGEGDLGSRSYFSQLHFSQSTITSKLKI